MQSVIDKVSSFIPTSDSPSGELSEQQKQANVQEALKAEINPPKKEEYEQYEGSNTGLSSVSASTAVEMGILGNPGGGNTKGGDEQEIGGGDGEPGSIARGPETAIYSQSAPTAVEQGTRGAPGGANASGDDANDASVEENLNGEVLPVNAEE